MKQIFALMIVAAFAFGCKNSAQNEPADSSENTAGTQQTEVQPEAVVIDTLALFDFVNGRFMDMSGEKFWSKDIFNPDYYEVCQKLNDFSDGDALWELGSVQELRSISLTDLAEFKIQDPTHIKAEAALDCKDVADGMEGTEFRTLSLILRDGQWLIDDVASSKEDKKKAVAEHEAQQK